MGIERIGNPKVPLSLLPSPGQKVADFLKARGGIGFIGRMAVGTVPPQPQADASRLAPVGLEQDRCRLKKNAIVGAEHNGILTKARQENASNISQADQKETNRRTDKQMNER